MALQVGNDFLLSTLAEEVYALAERLIPQESNDLLTANNWNRAPYNVNTTISGALDTRENLIADIRAAGAASLPKENTLRTAYSYIAFITAVFIECTRCRVVIYNYNDGTPTYIKAIFKKNFTQPNARPAAGNSNQSTVGVTLAPNDLWFQATRSSLPSETWMGKNISPTTGQIISLVNSFRFYSQQVFKLSQYLQDTRIVAASRLDNNVANAARWQSYWCHTNCHSNCHSDRSRR